MKDVLFLSSEHFSSQMLPDEGNVETIYIFLILSLVPSDTNHNWQQCSIIILFWRKEQIKWNIVSSAETQYRNDFHCNDLKHKRKKTEAGYESNIICTSKLVLYVPFISFLLIFYIYIKKESNTHVRLVV